MFGIHDYWLFIGTGILLNLTPGLDTMFIIGRSLTGGRRAGVASALGIAVGSICHTLAAALGFSAIIATSALAFTVVKLAGATYLIYLGVMMVCSKNPAAMPAEQALPGPSAQPWPCFRQGIITNVLNPKVALFFLAFLPQFIDPHSPTKALAFLTLGATFITTGLIWCLILASGAARLRSFFQRNPNVRAIIDRAVGALFVALGVRLVWSR
ncbi:MAG TPA: LysE family translocator [Steroidobacteraceae bacterium]|jgi:RhtB (resistance to homoserine/threonine) family protein|nr:LysE family translocator [Steroidobacteraceae bacterium]